MKQKHQILLISHLIQGQSCHMRSILRKMQINTYDITLNASGSVGTEYNKAKLDILFIVDTSESMNNDDRIPETKSY